MEETFIHGKYRFYFKWSGGQIRMNLITCSAPKKYQLQDYFKVIRRYAVLRLQQDSKYLLGSGLLFDRNKVAALKGLKQVIYKKEITVGRTNFCLCATWQNFVRFHPCPAIKLSTLYIDCFIVFDGKEMVNNSNNYLCLKSWYNLIIPNWRLFLESWAFEELPEFRC